MVQSCTYFFGVGLFRAFTMWLSMLNLAGRGISLSQTYFTKEPFFPLWNTDWFPLTQCVLKSSVPTIALLLLIDAKTAALFPRWMISFLARQKEGSIWLLGGQARLGRVLLEERRTPRLSGWTEQSLVRECWGLRHCPSSGGPKPGPLLFLYVREQRERLASSALFTKTVLWKSGSCSFICESSIFISINE